MTASKTDPYDIFSTQAQRDPALYDRMRNEDPIHAAIHPQTGQVFWFLTDYADCIYFLKDKRFGKEFRRHFPSDPAIQWIISGTEETINQHMLNLDDPAHMRLKSLVQMVFTPQRIHGLRPRLQIIADQLFDTIDVTIKDGDEFSLTEHYIGQFPLFAITEILGIPEEDYPSLYNWTQYILLSDEDTARKAILEFTRYLNDQIDLRQRNTGSFDDLLSGLIFSESLGDRLSRDELLSMVFLLITAGYETMVNFMNNSIMSLFENRDQLTLLQKNIHNPLVLKSAIEEMLRYNGPSHRTLPSWAFEDVSIRGKTIHRGDIVHAVLFAANRDPRIFSDPHQFNILRHPNKHIAFSYGIHHCLGAMLARLEGEIAIATLLRRMPDL